MNRQKEIIKVFDNDPSLVLSKEQIIAKSKINYYTNTRKHIGHVLTRMVRNKTLLRVKKGFYKLNITSNHMQNSLFKNI